MDIVTMSIADIASSTSGDAKNEKYITWFNSLAQDKKLLLIKYAYKMGNIYNITTVLNNVSDISQNVTKSAQNTTQSAQNTTQSAQNNLLTYSSANIGVTGETWVKNVLANEFLIENTTKVGHSGDFHIRFMQQLTIIEVKNYSRTVNSGEVKKFKNDLNMTSADCGVFISLNSKIAETNGDFVITYEMTNGKLIPCIYISFDTRSVYAQNNIQNTFQNTFQNTVQTTVQTSVQNSVNSALIIKSVYIVNNLRQYFANVLKTIADDDKNRGLVEEFREKMHIMTRSRLTYFEEITSINEILNRSYARYMRDEIDLDTIMNSMRDNIENYEIIKCTAAESIKIFNTKYFNNMLIAYIDATVSANVNSIVNTNVNSVVNSIVNANIDKHKLYDAFIKTYEFIASKFAKNDDQNWKFLKSRAVHTSGIIYSFSSSAANGINSVDIIMPVGKIPDHELISAIKSNSAIIRGGNIEIDICAQNLLAMKMLNYC